MIGVSALRLDSRGTKRDVRSSPETSSLVDAVY